MTTEDDFQAALDADPTDWQTRLVFADWLEDRDDPRAEGYRALGVLRLNPREPYCSEIGWCASSNASYEGLPDWAHCTLPDDWYSLTRALLACVATRCDEYWLEGMTREEAEHAAATAFARLPNERRTDLLKGAAN